MPPGAPVAILTYRYWQNRLGGDPSIVGRTLIINGKPSPSWASPARGLDSFSATIAVALFVPSGRSRSCAQTATASSNIGARRPGRSWPTSNPARRSPRPTRNSPSSPGASPRIIPRSTATSVFSRPRAALAARSVDGGSRAVFTALFVGLVGLVLFIACANVANLMGARAVDREKELVVRAALGASRARLVRQLLVESVLLALLAGFAGYRSPMGRPVSHRFHAARRHADPPRCRVGWQVWCFTGVISLIAGLASGLFPALRASRIDLNESLKQGGRARPASAIGSAICSSSARSPPRASCSSPPGSSCEA